jgi:LysR family nitrogen assimilation transcriptional regulator
LDLRQLRYFSKVVESGSFSKAANQLRIAQPALSQHVRHMEEELGVRLLHRGAQGVTPTEAGDRMLTHAKRILAEFAEIADSVRGEAIAPRGEVRFGCRGRSANSWPLRSSKRQGRATRKSASGLSKP